ncbi:MAG: hypothetical protein GY816_02140 [Cytophagales bacterium]|nr:hypothetical protein [Cytophagales bacterium]
MNIAFGTLLLLILLSPGFICRYAFLQGPYSRKNFQPSISDDIFWSVIPAFFIQLLAYTFLKFIGIQPSPRDLYLIVTGNEHVNFELIDASLFRFTQYTFVLLVISYLAGASARWIVTRYNLDLKYNILKVANEWHYLFSGKLTKEKVDLIQMDILVNSGNGTTLNSGILEDYFLNKDGGIDRLYLITVFRDNDYELPGDYFVIFGKEILNLNLTYFSLKEPVSAAK